MALQTTRDPVGEAVRAPSLGPVSAGAGLSLAVTLSGRLSEDMSRISQRWTDEHRIGSKTTGQKVTFRPAIELTCDCERVSLWTLMVNRREFIPSILLV